MTKIYCQPTDCESCPYEDCIGTIRQKPGRKKLPPDVLHQHRLEQNRRYQEAHREEIRRKNRERYHAKKNS
jgi:hypothetical protein